VYFRESEADSTPVWWWISADVPEDFVDEVRRVISVRPDAASMAVTMDDREQDHSYQPLDVLTHTSTWSPCLAEL